ncbi:sigma factor-like helix-turn-helix DNA-binding protein [Kitasatospora sp. NPDC058032]|uniref:sigma factor-like helix-turn-helix DNA-binding protein n=1 Tax=Kitasatospora sp. NPDC058032 TaxID=3346307 RepID=UPI0036DCF5CF
MWSHPWTGTAGRSREPGTHTPSLRPRCDFEAFVQLYGPQYWRYARTRLDDDGLGTEAVAWTFGHIEARWDCVLGLSQPMTVCWSLLRDTVSSRSAQGRQDGDWLHSVLPETAADAVLLRYRLGVDLPDAARLMGIGVGTVGVELRVALRMLARP